MPFLSYFCVHKRFDSQLGCCPLLENADAYIPDSVDLTHDHDARDYWLQCFQVCMNYDLCGEVKRIFRRQFPMMTQHDFHIDRLFQLISDVISIHCSLLNIVHCSMQFRNVFRTRYLLTFRTHCRSLRTVPSTARPAPRTSTRGPTSSRRSSAQGFTC